MQNVPYGYCHCGCGEKTNLAPYDGAGLVKGEPYRYIYGHVHRKAPFPYIEEDRGYRTQCWVWQWSTDTAGYAQLEHNGRTAKAPRVYYERAKGPVPLGLEIDHLCRVRACVNPDHLQPVTHAENIRRRPCTKCNLSIAMGVRLMRLTTTLTRKEIAETFGLTFASTASILGGRTWRL